MDRYWQRVYLHQNIVVKQAKENYMRKKTSKRQEGYKKCLARVKT